MVAAHLWIIVRVGGDGINLGGRMGDARRSISMKGNIIVPMIASRNVGTYI